MGLPIAKAESSEPWPSRQGDLGIPAIGFQQWTQERNCSVQAGF